MPAPRSYLLLLSASCILLALPLVGYMALGSNMRFTGDDYCYGGVVTRFGFWEAQAYSYTSATPYHGNRFSLTFLSGASSMLGPTTSGLLPGLVILLWLIGLAASIPLVGMGRRFTALEGLVAAETLVFFSLHMAPDLAQSLYWRSGMLPYLAPLALAAYLLGLILARSQATRPNLARLGAIVLLAVLAAGFSETAAAMQLGLCVLVLVGILLWRPSSGKAILLPALAALLGTLVAILLLYTSPSNQYRLATLPAPPDWLSLARMSLDSAYIFLYGTAKRLLLPHIVVFLVFLTVALGAGRRHSTLGKPRIGRTIALLVGVILGTFFVLMCLMAPSAWAQSSFPELRALIGARFATVLAAGIAGGILGMELARVAMPSAVGRALSGATILLVFGGSVYFPYLSLKQTAAEWPRYQKWARFWDARDRAIRDARDQGNMDIHIVQIDHIVPNVGELQPDDSFWYNNCAEDYYDVRSLSADLPGWDD